MKHLATCTTLDYSVPNNWSGRAGLTRAHSADRVPKLIKPDRVWSSPTKMGLGLNVYLNDSARTVDPKFRGG